VRLYEIGGALIVAGEMTPQRTGTRSVGFTRQRFFEPFALISDA